MVSPNLIAGGIGAAILLFPSGLKFDLDKWTITDTGLANDPFPEAIDNLQYMARYALAMHADAYKLGVLPKEYRVTSAFRSGAVNKVVGGSATSEHLFGLANDFYIPAVYDWLTKMRGLIGKGAYGPVHQTIIYPDSRFGHMGWYGPDDTRTARQFLMYKDGVYSNI